MKKPDLLGRTVRLTCLDDPTGAMALSVDAEVFVELAWSPEDRAVRAEIGDAVWWVHVASLGPRRSVLVEPSGYEVALYDGGPDRGIVKFAVGRRFEVSTRWSRRDGPWTGVADPEGVGLFRARMRWDAGSPTWDVEVCQDPVLGRFVVPVLLIWGGLQVVRARQSSWWLGGPGGLLVACGRALRRWVGGVRGPRR